MRLVHEHNREKVKKWSLKRQLSKIITLEMYDQINQLSDRRMLAQEYEIAGDMIMFENPIEAARYFRFAINIYLDVHKDDEVLAAEDISYARGQLSLAWHLQKEKGLSDLD